MKKKILSFMFVVCLFVPVIIFSGCFSNKSNDNPPSEPGIVEYKTINCKEYSANYFFLVDIENNTDEDKNFARSEFEVIFLDLESDNEAFLSRGVTLRQYDKTTGTMGDIISTNFVVEAGQTRAISFNINEFSGGVSLVRVQLKYNTKTISQFDINENYTIVNVI